MTPTELARQEGSDPKQVRQILRDWMGTLEEQGRGLRWLLSKDEVERVRLELRQRGN